MNPLDPVEPRLHGIGDPDRVHAHFLVQLERDGGLPVDAVVALGLLVGVVHGGHVAHADQPALVREQRRLPQLVRRPGAVTDGEGAEQAVLLHHPGLAHVLELTDLEPHIRGIDSERPDLVLVERDLDEPVAAPAHLHRRDPVHLQQLRHDVVVHVGAQRFEGVRAGQGVTQERALLLAELLRHVRLDAGRGGFGRQVVLQRGETLGEVEPGKVHVGAARELNRDVRPRVAPALARHRFDLLHAPHLLYG